MSESTEVAEEVAPEQVVDPGPQSPIEGVAYSESRGQGVLHPTSDQYVSTITKLRDAGYVMLIDLTVVDYLAHSGRPLPAGIAPERFEVVVNLLDMDAPARIRVRLQVADGAEPTVPSLYSLYPGVDALEREAFDMFGICFEGHPDLTRILMPEDWEGHPLRKDYSIGRVPVQFKAAPK